MVYNIDQNKPRSSTALLHRNSHVPQRGDNLKLETKMIIYLLFERPISSVSQNLNDVLYINVYSCIRTDANSMSTDALIISRLKCNSEDGYSVCNLADLDGSA